MKFSEIDKKWQNIWQEARCFETEINDQKPKYYTLEMFPYPSGKIHVGHLRNYSMGDLIARFKRACGFNVLYPMGWDSFGLPAENAAISNNTHPKTWTLENIDFMKSQIKLIGNSYDWRREITTCLPDYYKHEQSFFIKLLNKGIAYQKESIVNWDPVDKTVLANEQVVDGKGWRSGALVEKKSLKQWFLKITNYADELLEELENLEGWPDSVRTMQANWIGKSYGANIKFKIKDSSSYIEVYSTRPETLYGCSFISISYDHDILKEKQQDAEVKQFIQKCQRASLTNTDIEKSEKEGVKTVFVALHPFDESIEIPVFIANYVLKDYGTGAVFGCPGHDERDYEFAIKYSLPVKYVVEPFDEDPDNSTVYTGPGKMINSHFLNGLDATTAKDIAIKKLEELGSGTSKSNYKLRDWGISRQRYWGCPVPIVHCKDCGPVAVPEEDLPVTLPDDVEFTGLGNPLDKHQAWKHVKCPSCKKDAIRETDTFDTFFESSWYFARYCSNHSNNMVDKESADYWLPVDQYIGGIEHAVMHLLYARFFTKCMNEEGVVSVREPFKNLLTQGMVLHASYKNPNGEWVYPDEVVKTKEGLVHKTTGEKITEHKLEKMSKSKKNVVDLDSIIRAYGADTIRLFILSDSPPERDLEWSATGVEGCCKFLFKLYNFSEKLTRSSFIDQIDAELNAKTHVTIRDVTSDINNFHFNKAIARIRELFNDLVDIVDSIKQDHASSTAKFALKTIIRLLNPFCPHITEEIWSIIDGGEILAKQDWPEYKEAFCKKTKVNLAVQINGKLRATFLTTPDTEEEELKKICINLPEIQKHIEGREIAKTIVVPGKIINFVVR
ncbi:MAG: leucine--tRNA ligase [Rickettsiaceae bacterium]|nr:leucine--tRNA ligase [Rickettsiaceae bacterium]